MQQSDCFQKSNSLSWFWCQDTFIYKLPTTRHDQFCVEQCATKMRFILKSCWTMWQFNVWPLSCAKDEWRYSSKHLKLPLLVGSSIGQKAGNRSGKMSKKCFSDMVSVIMVSSKHADLCSGCYFSDKFSLN